MTGSIKTIRAAALLITGLLFFAGYLQAQERYADAIQNRFDQYRNNTLQEKIYVHTDKNFYLAGEILWYKAYNVDGTFHAPINLSKIAYVELLDKDNKPVMQAKTALKKGNGNGSFYLPVSLNSGNYTLRAYTNWMKNFGADYYFEKQLTIVNPLKPLNIPVSFAATNYDVQFFPEGGYLVNGIESTVGFKVTDPSGKGVVFSGTLINEKNDTLLSFQPLKFGMGHFKFTPSAGHTYRAIIKLENGLPVFGNLPSQRDAGYVLHLGEETPGAIKITVTAAIPAAGNNSEEIFLLAHTRQLIKVTEKKSLNNNVAVFTIEKDKLGEGISQITIFNSRKQPLCERLYFKPPQHTLSITAASNAKQYAVRKKVDLSILSKTTTGIPVPAAMSLSVYRMDSLQALDQDDILSYLWLTSDLKGNIESPGYYFYNEGAEADAAADNLVLTQGWRRFNWDTILNRDRLSFEYVPEHDGHIITGKVINNYTKMPATGIESYLSVPGILLQFYPSLSNSEGHIRFDVRNYYGQNEIIAQTHTSKEENYSITIANPFSEKYSGRRLPPFNLSADLQRLLTANSLGMQVQNAYANDKLRQFEAPVIDSLPFYGKATKTYLLDDYTRFNTMEEVLREYVPEVEVQRANGQFRFRVASWSTGGGIFSSDPLTMLDGVPTPYQKILEFDPLKVKKLEVFTNRYVLGEFMYDGIISFTTYNGNREDIVIDPKAVIMDYEGLQLKREFYSPVYATAQQINSHVPDFRSLLYWSPDVQSDKEGAAQLDFYTSDIKGRYVAVIQGMDDAGNAGSYFFMFDVNGDK